MDGNISYWFTNSGTNVPYNITMLIGNIEWGVYGKSVPSSPFLKSEGILKYKGYFLINTMTLQIMFFFYLQKWREKSHPL